MLGRIGLQESMFYQQTVVSKQSFWTEAILGGSRNKMPHLENCLQSLMCVYECVESHAVAVHTTNTILMSKWQLCLGSERDNMLSV